MVNQPSIWSSAVPPICNGSSTTLTQTGGSLEQRQLEMVPNAGAYYINWIVLRRRKFICESDLDNNILFTSWKQPVASLHS
jgi:hypothetical protein